MAVEWERVGQPGFDRIVEAVVHRVYEASARVEAVNGRGGDDGIDIKVIDGSRVRVFQLKYYLDGFPTGSFKGRRKSIRESFARAMRQGPQEWVLVVPCVLTAAEREFVLSLGAGQAVQVEVWDRAKLDDLLSVHPDVEASFTRDQPSSAHSAALAHLACHARADTLPGHLRTCQCRERGCSWHPRHRGCGGPVLLALTRDRSGRTWRLADTCAACAAATSHTAVVPDTLLGPRRLRPDDCPPDPVSANPGAGRDERVRVREMLTYLGLAATGAVAVGALHRRQ
ncbi:hypothetical protein IQ62_26370 [Streptomyces scabiei]|nr:hypothetical protein IQ62_26370 [Streptomyces scabiei]